MEQQDTEEYFNYNYNSIYSNQYTENTPNEDQIIDNQQDIQNLELEESLNEKSKLEKIIDLMKCYICYNTVQEAFMCPGCSNFACDKCIQQYLQDNKECPVCRKDLSIDQVVKCRFLKDFLKCVQNINEQKLKSSVTSQQNLKKEYCEDHNLKMIYFCMDCNTVVCSDCVMFTKKHKIHKFERVKTIYDQKMDNINKELTDLKLKIQLHENYLQEIDQKSQELKKTKEQKARDLIQLYKQLNYRLDQDLEKNQQKLEEEKKRAEKEYEFYENMHQDIQCQIENQTASQVIEKANDFLQVLMEINSKNFIKTLNHQQYDLNEDLSIPYFSSTFYLKPYSLHKQQNDIVYSDPLIADGIEWRIKVYPNGTGIYNGLYLSLFVEMVSGWKNGGQYSYKVKLINLKNEKESIQKEYVSDFENSICWGYNRFCKIDDIENQGYLDKDNDQIIIQYQVRPANHLQKLKDQEYYIKFLEQKINKKQQQNKDNFERSKKNRTMSEELMTRSYCANSVHQRNKKNYSQIVISNKKFQSNKLFKKNSTNIKIRNNFSIETNKKKKNKSLLNKAIKEDSFQRSQQILFIQIKFKFTNQ